MMIGSGGCGAPPSSPASFVRMPLWVTSMASDLLGSVTDTGSSASLSARDGDWRGGC
jgi:hypothetical protein